MNGYKIEQEKNDIDPICKRVTGRVNLLSSKSKSNFIALKYRMALTENGKGEMVFDTSLFRDFTIVVGNNGSTIMEACLKEYPELKGKGIIDSYTARTIQSMQQEIFVGKMLMNYTAIDMTGLPNSDTTVYLQGQY